MNWNIVEPSAGDRIFECDKEALKVSRAKTDGLDFRLLPEPFVGDVEHAKVILLNGNPFFDESDIEYPLRQEFEKRAQANWQNRHDQFPFYYFDPRFSTSGGARYWIKRFRAVTNLTSADEVARNVAVIESFPYKSKSNPKENSWLRKLPSVAQLRLLAEKAVTRGAVVIALRAEWAWSEVAFIEACSNPQQPYLTEKQLPNSFRSIIGAINS